MSRVIKVMNNKRVTARVGGKKCHFRSLFEYRWAQYLNVLVMGGEIVDWTYEPPVFVFHGETTAPVQYRMDFEILCRDGTYHFQECKGYHDAQTNTKLKRMAKHYPDIVIELVRQRIPRKGKEARKLEIAAKYVRRIIDAEREIFPHIKGMIQWNPPIVGEM